MPTCTLIPCTLRICLQKVADLEGDVVDLDEDIDFLFDEQVLQDERILQSEQRLTSTEQRLLQVETEAEHLEDSVTGSIVFLNRLFPQNGVKVCKKHEQDLRPTVKIGDI